MSRRPEPRRLRNPFYLGLNHEHTARQTHDKEHDPHDPSAVTVNVTTDNLQRFHHISPQFPTRRSSNNPRSTLTINQFNPKKTLFARVAEQKNGTSAVTSSFRVRRSFLGLGTVFILAVRPRTERDDGANQKKKRYKTK